MRFYIKFLIIIFVLFLVPYFALSDSSEIMYFKLFFQRQQPKEYFDFPKTETKKYDYNIYEPHYDYQELDDFKTPSTWSLSNYTLRDLDSFASRYKATSADPAESYLNWKTLNLSNPVYMDEKTPSLKSNPNDPSVPFIKTLLGVRAYYFRTGSHTFVMYPKTPIPFKTRGEIYNLDIWVFGINKEYNMYVELLDYMNMYHKVFIGNLHYDGWKRFVVNLDIYHIPNANHAFMNEDYLKVTKFIFETRNSMTNGFFGTWLSDFGFDYRSEARIEKAKNITGTVLADEFNWPVDTAANAPQQGAAPVNNANTPAAQPGA